MIDITTSAAWQLHDMPELYADLVMIESCLAIAYLSIEATQLVQS